MVREFHRVYAALNSFDAALNPELLLVFVESIHNYLPVIRTRGEEITATHVCST